MEQIYKELASSLSVLLKGCLPSRRLVVAVAGSPGSGKSTLAQRVVDILNASNGQEIALVVGMDGFHLTKAELDAMQDPVRAHARRGAPFTFGPEPLIKLIREVREKPNEILFAPSFDHAVGDPVENDIRILPQHRVVLFEGLYLLMNQPPWNQIPQLCDESWFIESSLEESSRRVALRHVQTGLAMDLEAGKRKWETNDKLNAMLVIENSIPATRTIRSISETCSEV